MQGDGWAVKEDGGDGGRWMGSLEMIGRKCATLSASSWPSKLPKMSPRASETNIEVSSLFVILSLFQRDITSQLVVSFSQIMSF